MQCLISLWNSLTHNIGWGGSKSCLARAAGARQMSRYSSELLGHPLELPPPELCCGSSAGHGWVSWGLIPRGCLGIWQELSSDCSSPCCRYFYSFFCNLLIKVLEVSAFLARDQSFWRGAQRHWDSLILILWEMRLKHQTAINPGKSIISWAGKSADFIKWSWGWLLDYSMTTTNRLFWTLFQIGCLERVSQMW